MVTKRLEFVSFTTCIPSGIYLSIWTEHPVCRSLWSWGFSYDSVVWHSFETGPLSEFPRSLSTSSDAERMTLWALVCRSSRTSGTLVSSSASPEPIFPYQRRSASSCCFRCTLRLSFGIHPFLGSTTGSIRFFSETKWIQYLTVYSIIKKKKPT